MNIWELIFGGVFGLCEGGNGVGGRLHKCDCALCWLLTQFGKFLPQ